MRRRWAFACAAVCCLGLACSSGKHTSTCAPHYFYVVGDWAGPAFGAGVIVGVGGWYDPVDDGTSDPVADGTDTQDGTDDTADTSGSSGDDTSGGGADPGAGDPGAGDGVMTVTANQCTECTIVCVANSMVNGASGSGDSHDAACAAAIGALEHWARPARLSACREVASPHTRAPASPTVSPVGTFGTRVSRALSL